VDSGSVLDSSPERSFLIPKSRVFLTGLAREAQERETGSIESEWDLRGGSGVSWARNCDFRESQVFSPKFISLLLSA